MGRSLSFASNPCDFIAHLRLAFASAPVGYTLTLPQKLTRRLIMQKARRHPPEGRLRPLVSTRFQGLLAPLVGVLFTIQSPYWSTIGRQGVFSLGGWAPQLHAEFHELDATLVHLDHAHQQLQDFHLLWFSIQTDSMPVCVCHIGVHNPAPRDGLGFSDFARRY